MVWSVALVSDSPVVAGPLDLCLALSLSLESLRRDKIAFASRFPPRLIEALRL